MIRGKHSTAGQSVWAERLWWDEAAHLPEASKEKNRKGLPSQYPLQGQASFLPTWLYLLKTKLLKPNQTKLIVNFHNIQVIKVRGQKQRRSATMSGQSAAHPHGGCLSAVRRKEEPVGVTMWVNPLNDNSKTLSTRGLSA